MLVCCGNGKPWEEMSDIERLSCEHDHCTGPREETEEDRAMKELVEFNQKLGLYKYTGDLK